MQKPFSRRQVLSSLGTNALLLGVAATPLRSLAQDAYPTRSVRVVAPFPPGQGTDIIARLLAQQLSTAMGQSFYVDNKPGAGGVIGARTVKDAAPDGYTLLVAGGGPLAINASLYAKLPYDPVKDFQPVRMIAAVPNILVVRPDFPARNLQELVEYVRQRPGQLTFASSGSGVPGHLIMEMFKATAKLDMTHIPYQGAGAAITGLMAGDTAMMFDTAGALIPQVKSGKLRAIATASPLRSQALPDLPTVKESGYPDFSAQGWSALVAPTGTPAEVISRLYDETTRVLAHPDMRQRLIDTGADPVSMTTAETAAYMKSEVAYWARAVKLSGAKAG